MQQGVLIPNDWETELTAIPFDGFFETAGGYMPWFSQFKGRNGYIAICTTPWNAGYQAEHPENGPYTHVGVRFEPSLGRMDYKRVVRYTDKGLKNQSDTPVTCNVDGEMLTDTDFEIRIM